MYEDYRPEPVDISEVMLSGELKRLVGRLARNQHEVTAREYFEAGWAFGDSRDTAKRLTPMLMPYSELTEVQRQWDIRIAETVVKTIIAMGYRIEKDQRGADAEADVRQ